MMDWLRNENEAKFRKATPEEEKRGLVGVLEQTVDMTEEQMDRIEAAIASGELVGVTLIRPHVMLVPKHGVTITSLKP
jgi:hypothetical protein